MEKQRLNTEEAAAYVGLQPMTLRIWRCKTHREKAKEKGKDSGPPFIKLGERVLYDRAALDRWLQSNTVGAEVEVAS